MNDEAALAGGLDTGTRTPDDTSRRGRKLTAAERLGNPDAVLSRSDLRDLGWERRGVDAIMRGCPVVRLPGYARPLVRVSDYLALLEMSTYTGDRVRP